jgi:hypothetical protein
MPGIGARGLPAAGSRAAAAVAQMEFLRLVK